MARAVWGWDIAESGVDVRSWTAAGGLWWGGVLALGWRFVGSKASGSRLLGGIGRAAVRYACEGVGWVGWMVLGWAGVGLQGSSGSGMIESGRWEFLAILVARRREKRRGMVEFRLGLVGVEAGGCGRGYGLDVASSLEELAESWGVKEREVRGCS